MVIGCVERIDPDDSNYSPVAAWTTVRVALSMLALHEDWQMDVVDISQAYTQAEPRKQMFVRAPQNIDGYGPHHVFELQRNLYGLRSAGKQWYLELSKHLVHQGFRANHSDAALFTKIDDDNKLIMVALVYVDDILLLGSRKDLTEFQTRLKERFRITTQVNAQEYLGMSVTMLPNRSIAVCQTHKIDIAIEMLGLGSANTTHTPMNMGQSNEEMAHSEMCDDDHIQIYRSVVGLVLHIANVYRGDIAFTIAQLCRYNQQPRMGHYKALTHLVKYLRATRTTPLMLGTDKDQQELISFSDASWGGAERGRSTSGELHKFAGGTVAYASRKQDTVATSTAHAELVALSACARSVLHLQTMLSELQVTQTKTIVFTDTQAAVRVAKALGSTPGTKHLRREDFFVQDCMQRGALSLRHVASKENMSDVFTKALPRAGHHTAA